jgi:hypothetical protein
MSPHADPHKDRHEHHPQPSKGIELTVRYIGARRPFEEHSASPGQTLAEVKVLALKFFGLVEGPANGGSKVYVFSLNKEVLTDLSVTIGKLADCQHHLKLDLVERFEQG